MKTYQSPKSPKNPGLSKAWISFCASPDNQDELARQLDALLKSRLPDGRCQEPIAGQEDEIRQEAYLLLVQRYLSGNPALFDATEVLDMDEIAEQIERSARASLTAVKRAMKKAALKRAHRHDDDTSLDAVCGADHPANRGNLWALPYEVQRALVFSTLRRAADENLLPQQSVSLATDMIELDLTQSLVAKAQGVTRQSVHQHLARVREVLKSEITHVEFPMASAEEGTRDV
jgi:DNA-directed RNA polymerase specialized sigma24 family protein